jgi:hypothetical protein
MILGAVLAPLLRSSESSADLGVLTSRANTGNTLALQWSLPG